jgi:chromosome segregation ATPase
MDESSKTAEYLQENIMKARAERDRLEKEFDMITKQPFFKRETDSSHFKTLQELQKRADDKDRDIRKTKESIVKMD